MPQAKPFRTPASTEDGIDLSDIPDAPVDVSDLPDAPKSESLIKKAIDIAEWPSKRIASGTDRQIQGPGLMEIPGISNVTSKIEHAIDPTDSPFYTGVRPFIAGGVKLLGDTLASGFDPRTAGVMRENVPVVDAKPVAEDIPLPREPKLLGPAPTQPTFISGEAGTAVNRPYNIDLGTVSPRLGQTDATVLPREAGEVNQIPPDLAARSGTTLGRPTTQIPVNPNRLLTGDVAPSTSFTMPGREGYYTGEGNAR